jgi:hypothetical protein
MEKLPELISLSIFHARPQASIMRAESSIEQQEKMRG